jgi:Ca2+-binding EF-hand superfamily protein
LLNERKVYTKGRYTTVDDIKNRTHLLKKRMPAPSVSEQRDVFEMFDYNRDGNVNKEEFAT